MKKRFKFILDNFFYILCGFPRKEKKDIYEYWSEKKKDWILLYQYYDDIYLLENGDVPIDYYPPNNKNRLNYVKNQLANIRDHRRHVYKQQLLNNIITNDEYEIQINNWINTEKTLLENEIYNYNQKDFCCICFEKIREECTLFPCNHSEVCIDCVRALEICPLCRTVIQSYIIQDDF